MNKLIYISILFLLAIPVAEAQDKKYVYRDSTLIQGAEELLTPEEYQNIEVVPLDEDSDGERNFSNSSVDTTLYWHMLYVPIDSIDNWKKNKWFSYIKNIDSLLKAKKNGVKKNEKTASGPGLLDRFFSSGLLKITLWTLAGFFILFIIYRLFLTEGLFTRASRSVSSELPEVDQEKVSGETDFDLLIEQAVQNNNYRQAVRYQYLKILHRMAGKNWIELAPDKTNFQYVCEVKNLGFQNDFASVTLSYEYVWYGEFDIDRGIYQKLESNFLSLHQKV